MGAAEFKALCKMIHDLKRPYNWVVVVAQMVERNPSTPDVRSLIQFMGKIYIERLLSSALNFEKTKIKEVRGRE